MTEPGGTSQDPVVEPSCSPAEAPADSAQHLDFRDVYEAELDYVYHSLRRLGVADRDLEDLIHEVFFAFYRGRDHYDPARPLRPWLFGIAFRVASDWRRRAQQRYEIPDEREAADHAPGADELYAACERRRLVARALDTLDLDKRAVFVMHELDGFTMPEIAQVIAAPLNTLYSRLRLAREEFTAFVRRQQGKSK